MSVTGGVKETDCSEYHSSTCCATKTIKSTKTLKEKTKKYKRTGGRVRGDHYEPGLVGGNHEKRGWRS